MEGASSDAIVEGIVLGVRSNTAVVSSTLAKYSVAGGLGAYVYGLVKLGSTGIHSLGDAGSNVAEKLQN